MSRADAEAWYREIVSGEGVDREDTPVKQHRGRLAERLWDDGRFTLGVEYGVLIALCRIFDIDPADLRGEP